MQKKILISFAMSGLAAFPALADVSLPQYTGVDGSSGWKDTNMQGVTPDGDSGVSCGVGVGDIIKTINLPKGKYQLKFTGLTNGQVAVKVGDQTLATSKDANATLTVELTSDTQEVRIEVSRLKTGVYSFSSFEMTLLFDVQKVYDRLKKSVDEITYFAQANQNLRENNASLAADYDWQRTSLLNEKDAIEGVLDDIKDTPVEGSGLFGNISTYETYRLYDTPNVVDNDIEAFRSSLVEYNAKVDADNTKYDNFVINKANRDAYRETVATYETKVAEAQNSVDALELTAPGAVEYKKTLKDRANALSAEVDNLKKTVEEKYADENLYNSISLGINVDELGSNLDTLIENINDAQADLSAYDAYWGEGGKMDDLEASYRKDVTDVNSIKGVSGFEDVFAANNAKVVDGLTKRYEEAVSKISNEISGFAAVSAAATTENPEGKDYAGILAVAKTDMDKMTQDAENLATAENNAYDNGIDQANVLQATLDEEVAKATVPDEYKKDWDALVAKAQASVDSYRESVRKHYEANDGRLETAENELKSIEATFNQRLADLGKYYMQPLVYLQSQLGALENNVAAYAGNLTGEYSFDVNAKFANTYASIQDAIDALKDVKDLTLETPAAVDIQNSIDAIAKVDESGKIVSGTAKTYIDGFVNAMNAIVPFSKDYADLVKLCDGKLVLPPDEAESVKSIINYTYLTPLQTKLNKFKSDYQAAAAAEGYVGVEKAAQLTKDVEASGWKTSCDDAKTYIVRTVSEGSYQRIQDLVADSKANAAQYESEGMFGFSGFNNGYTELYKEIDELLKASESAFNAAANVDVTAGNFASVWAALDNANKKVYDKIAPVDARIQALVDNWNTYNSLLDYFGYVDSQIGMPTDKGDDTTYGINSSSPTAEAKGYFNELIYNLKSRLNLVKTDVETAGSSLNAVAQNSALSERISALETENMGLQSKIKQNTMGYNEVFEAAQKARKMIDGYLSQLENSAKYNQEAVAGNIAELKKLRDETLYDLNQEILASVNKGELADAGILTVYENRLAELDEAANGAFTKANTEYNNNVAAVNASKYNNWLTASYNPTYNVYKKSVEQYNKYDALSNPGLVEALNFAEFKNSSNIYEYNRKIQDQDVLFQQEVARLNALSTAQVVPTSFIDARNAKLGEYKTAMDGDVAALNTEMNNRSKNYYQNTLLPESTTAYNDVKAALDGAGIPTSGEDVLLDFKTLETAYNNAVGSYNTHNGSADFTVSNMNGIANNLDKVIAAGTAEGIQGLAKAAWNTAYAAAQAEIEEMLAEIDACEFASNKDAEMVTFNDNKKLLEELAAAVSSVTAGLINKYASDKALLDGYMAAMRGAYDRIIENNDNNVECREIYAEYTALLDAAEENYNSVLKFAEGLMVRDDADVLAVQDEIDALRNTLKDNMAVLNTMTATLETEMAKVETSVSDGYVTVRNAEYLRLQKMLTDVKDCYNKQVVAGVLTSEQQVAFEDRINPLSDNIAAMNLAPVGNDTQRAEFLKNADAYEAELCQLLVDMDPAQYPDAALETLNTLSGSIQDELTAAMTYLAGCTDQVKARFAKTYGPMQETLDGIKTAYEAEGNNVIYLTGFFTDELGAVRSEISKANAEVQKYEANQVAYNRLDALYTKYNTEYEALVEGIISGAWLYDFEWGVDEDGNTIVLPTLRTRLAAAKSNLDRQYGAVTLNGSSTLLDQTLIADELLTADKKYLILENGVSLSSTDYALNAANNVLFAQNIAPETKAELRGRLNVLNSRYWTVSSNVDYIDRGVNPETGEPVGTQTEEARWKDIEILKNALVELADIRTSAGEIETEAEEAKYIKGDVNLNPDGIVNIVDIQMIINWVGQRVGYWDLYAENQRQALSADMNSDEILNIADITGVISEVANPDKTPGMMKIGAPYQQLTEGSLSVKLVSEEDGVRRYALYLDNSVPFVAGQLDIAVAPGMRVTGAEAAGRAAGHEMYLFEHSDGARLIIASMENAVFEGTDGIVGYIDVEGAGDFSVEDIIFADDNCVTYRLAKVGTSKIDNIIDSVKNGMERIYNAAGHQFNKLQKGINIIRHKDGTTTKEMKK